MFKTKFNHSTYTKIFRGRKSETRPIWDIDILEDADGNATLTVHVQVTLNSTIPQSIKFRLTKCE
jgi:hypothetical protein